MTDLSPLDPAACPLLFKHGGADAAGLLARFNAAAAEVRALQADKALGPWLASPKAADLLAPLGRVRERITAARYVVGCIGLTQAGKSTTINNVLGEEVCKPGSGDATSSQPSRVTFAPTRSLAVEYLSPQLVADRREALCKAINLPSPPDDRDLLPMLDRPDEFRPTDGPEPARLKEDLAYLKEFLAARARHANLLAAPGKVVEGLPYDQRYKYTTHTPGAASSENLLVREARFRTDNRKLPDDLELCDLPGLDSKRTIDDVVTWEYLPGLHGTFLFVNVGMNLLSQATLTTLGRIQKQFEGRMAGRAWLIFNKMDSLTGDHFRAGQDNVFATLARLLEKTGIPESQVCFCSKRIWDKAAASGGAVEPAFAAAMMSQTADAPVPETCPPGLRGAWTDLLADGGVGRIRALMFKDVAEALAGQIRQDVAARLGQFEQQFAARVKAERDRLSMDDGDLQAAMTCLNVVLQLRATLATRPADFPILVQEGERLRRALADLFDTGSTAEVLTHLPPAELPGQFRTHARVLDQRLRAEVAGDVLDRVYQVVGQKLEGLPPVPVGPGRRPCHETWAAAGLADRADDGWRAALPGFGSDDLVRWLKDAGADGIDGAVYVDLMRDKIDLAVRGTVHAVRSRLRSRLGEIAGELALITGGPDDDAAA